MLLSVLIALGAGFNEQIGYALSLSRTFYFFPFFLIGHLYGRPIFKFLDKYRWGAGPLFLGAVGVVFWWSMIGLPHDVLYGSKSYALVAAIAFILVIPKKSGFLAYLGERLFPLMLLGFLGLVLMLSYASAPANNVVMAVCDQVAKVSLRLSRRLTGA